MFWTNKFSTLVIMLDCRHISVYVFVSVCVFVSVYLCLFVSVYVFSILVTDSNLRLQIYDIPSLV